MTADKVTRYHCYKWEGDEQIHADEEVDPEGDWVRYDDVKHLLTPPSSKDRSHGELEDPIALANRVLDRPSGDPDDDLAILARQFLRAHEARTAFKNFHRLLCERFGYGHDDKDWQRDQLSLIEHIARSSVETKALQGLEAVGLRPNLPRCDLVLHFDGVDHAQAARARIYEAFGLPGSPVKAPAPACDACHDTGQICVGYSGREDDGNAPLLERCPSCGYGSPVKTTSVTQEPK